MPSPSPASTSPPSLSSYLTICVQRDSGVLFLELRESRVKEEGSCIPFLLKLSCLLSSPPPRRLSYVGEEEDRAPLFLWGVALTIVQMVLFCTRPPHLVIPTGKAEEGWASSLADIYHVPAAHGPCFSHSAPPCSCPTKKLDVSPKDKV